MRHSTEDLNSGIIDIIKLLLKKMALFLLILVLLQSFSLNSQIDLPHEFIAGPTDGAFPLGSLLLSGSFLFGMTQSGCVNGFGAIFEIGTDGNAGHES